MNQLVSTPPFLLSLFLFAVDPVFADQFDQANQAVRLQIPDCGALQVCSFWIEGQPATEVYQRPKTSEDVETSDTLSIEIRDENAETRDFLEVEPHPEMFHQLQPGNWRVGAGFGAFRAPEMRVGSAAMKGTGSGIELQLMRRVAQVWSLIEFNRERESRIDRFSNLIVESRFDSIGLGFQTLRPINNQQSALPLHFGLGTSLIGGYHKSTLSFRNISSDESGNVSVSVDRKSTTSDFFGIGGLISISMPATDGVWFCAKLEMQYLTGNLSSGKRIDFGKSTVYFSMLYGF